MKLLHIDSSILGDHSASRALTAKVVAALKAATPGLEVSYHDLAHDALGDFSAASLTAGATPAEQRSAEQRDEAERNARALQEFLAADVLVLGAPMYNFTIPTQLKAWIDRITVAGTTFRYSEAGPVGLCEGKKAIIVATAGGIHAGKPTGLAHADYLKLVLSFLGITDVQTVYAEGLAYGDEAKSAALASAERQIAEQFA
ncbi:MULTISPECIES: NAD(P)H-dependent oxidoreductase [Pseudomonadaceae]|uniref:FMN dependent NADH:quinone oxidoreductase n=1 Tax=Pseudomonas oryzihabitans TaxID=47885 RepID=A0ABX3J0P5_9PSED|nr:MULTISPECIES: NAD(P)H-dependent oxidoreductase [Pseudomonas]MCI1008487.1 NAD(P)H-dependent oxidoreductase [Pseudomonas oryzihabitans]MDU4056169.1 NAD(P)H-dependent oxidoreductase [Pseudomonas oryzihabitans]ONN72904.1 FMN-dependent NADH-azoreductase [Pseudomonas psychrotolerans]OYT84515.1 MAG: FMN-dependent NADH-azoreductase [Pseudomonas sp. PGPPP4]RAU40624.1 FMN-dependent NADH-azoreductase [Pseudomonas sp. RIT 411]